MADTRDLRRCLTSTQLLIIKKERETPSTMRTFITTIAFVLLQKAATAQEAGNPPCYVCGDESLKVQNPDVQLSISKMAFRNHVLSLKLVVLQALLQKILAFKNCLILWLQDVAVVVMERVTEEEEWRLLPASCVARG